MKLAEVYFRAAMPFGIGLACGAERGPVLDVAASTVTLADGLVVPLTAVLCYRVAPPEPVPTDETQPETPAAKRGKR